MLGARRTRLFLAFAAVLLAVEPAPGEPLAREDVPGPLRPWIDWVLRGHESETCPFLNASGERHCVWPSRLELDLDAAGGRFAQELFVAAPSDVFLPGGAGEPPAWPEDVRVGGAPAPVLELGGRPGLRLARGVHRVSGRFAWPALPPVLAVPPETGVLALRLAGEPVPFPRRDTQGRLWLREPDTTPRTSRAESHLEVDVHRRVLDEIPLRLETRVTLRVAGEAREELLGRALPDGFVPLRLEGPLPARLDPDGRLRVQLRPGRFTLVVAARHAGPAPALRLPTQPRDETRPAAWDASEVWVVEARPALRLVEVEGVAPVDPGQTELPDEWRHLPAYRVGPEDELRLVEKQRGSEGGAADRLVIERTWHLDFDGGGASVSDRIQGSLRSATRLEMDAGTGLGRAAVNGADQPITRRAGSELLGLEVPLGPVEIEADARVEGGAGELPALGWAHDFDGASGTLELPPGWRLLHAGGVDAARTTWIGRWTLLDLFVVMVVAMGALRLYGLGPGVLAFATLALTYTEPGAPRLAWVAVLAGEALRRVVSPGRLAGAVRVFHATALASLVILAVPFAVSQVRSGLFPALERPWGVVQKPEAADAVTALEAPPGAEPVQTPELQAKAVAELDAGAPGAAPGEGPEEPGLRRYVDVERLTKESRAGGRPAGFAPDPDASVPTGPGRPDWRWQRVVLTWSGPVERGQTLSLWLVPPWANGVLALLRTGLLAALALLVLRDLRGRFGGIPRVLRRAAAVLALLAALPSPPARAEFPSPELLGELRSRLLEPPECHPSCATLSRLGLGVSPERLDLRLAVSVAAETALPLPGGSGSGGEAGFVPDAVAVDGRAAEGLRSDEAGRLWVRLAPGSHVLVLSGALPPRATLELPLPLRPQRVEIVGTPRGWTVVGVQADGRAGGALQLVRDAAAGRPTGPEARLEPTPIPPFVRVERALELGLTWNLHTKVVRVAPPEGALVLEVPLLPGESVTTPGVRVRERRALVTLGPGAGVAGWSSLLATSERIALEAPRDVAWTEVWRLEAGGLWHVEAEGIPPVDLPSEGRRFREWRPWPGEAVGLAVERPEGAGGGTLTLDRSELVLRPGLRATDASLGLALRSSQGGQHAVTLPEGAELTGIQMDGVAQPLRQEGRRVPIALAPGRHQLALAWREPRGTGVLLRGSEVDLGLPSVNAHVTFEMPQSRWILYAGGPRLGPVVLFWPILVVVAGLAYALGRVPWTPLRARHWLLLGLGLTQAPFAAAALVAVWLLALGWRGRRAERLAEGSPRVFDLLQVSLAVLTIAALASLVFAIQMGLLGAPQMQIAGNGSGADVLRWYQDRADALLPRPWVFSLSVWFYRLAMLAWSLWLAQSLLRWLRWGFAQWSAGGLWRPRRVGRPGSLEPSP